MAHGDFTYTPPVNINVVAECIGGGGFARLGTFFDSNNQFMGPGGGGAAYVRKHAIPLIGGVGYAVRVGAPGNEAAPHESFFILFTTVGAEPGGNASNSTIPGTGGGPGGSAATSNGDVKFSGGDGQNYLGPDNTARSGGGGGSSAGRSGAGNPGVLDIGGTIVDGGAGGNGGHAGPGGAGSNGTAPGGGGGGGGTPANGGDPGSTAGLGSEGYVAIWEDVGIWPPPTSGPGSTPLYEQGTPPPVPPPAPAKLAKRAFMS